MNPWGPKHVELEPKWPIKNLLSEITLCILLDYIYIAKNDTRTLQCQVNFSVFGIKDRVDGTENSYVPDGPLFEFQ